MRARGLTLLEVIVAFWLLLATLVMASAILHQTLRHLRQQEHTTRGTFLAQGKLEEFMRVPSARLAPAQGRFPEPFQEYGWSLAVERKDDFWELRLEVEGPCQSRARVLAQRRLEPRSLWFSGNRDGLAQLYRINENGTELKRMTKTRTAESQPALSPDGTEVAFVSHRAGHSQIFAMPANGSGTPRLLADGRPSVSEPAWSPDGKSLAYAGYERGVSQIMVLNLASGLAENRSRNAQHESSPSWCPDGNGLLFVMADPQGGGSQIGWMSASGERRRRQLTRENGWNTAPSMSPDGATIAFMGGQAGNPEIYLMNAGGGQRRRLTQDGAYDHAPRFSSDGQRLVFWSERNGGPELYTMDVDGGKLRRVLPKAQLLPGQFERDPAWVP